MTKFPHIPLVEDSTPDNPRSYWDRLMMEEEARERAKVRASARQQAAAAQAKLPRPDPNTRFRVTTMAPTRAFMNRDRAVAPEAVMGVRRPEFGPSPVELKSRLRVQSAGSSKSIYEPDYSSPLQRPSVEMMTEATSDAFRTVGTSVPMSGLSTEFSRVNTLPDFSQRGWKRAYSTHSTEAYEHPLPGYSGMVLKVYLGDQDHDGANTATITAPTSSVDHYGAWPAFQMGLPVNSRNAATYLRDRRAAHGQKK